MTEADFLECKAPSAPPNLAPVWRDMPPPKAAQAQVEVSATTVYKAVRGALLALRELLKSRLISLPIGFSAPLEDGAQAFAHVAAGRPGRAILKPNA